MKFGKMASVSVEGLNFDQKAGRRIGSRKKPSFAVTNLLIKSIRSSSRRQQLQKQNNIRKSAGYKATTTANDEIVDLVEDEDFSHYSCNKCGKTYKIFLPYKRHTTVCRESKNPIQKTKVNKISAKDVKLKFKRTKKKYAEMENESVELSDINICFCCAEPLDEAHTGHIRCFYCPKSFKSGDSLERHIVLLHAPNELYPCNICSATCPTSVILELHMNTHKLGKQFVCKKCGKEFTRKYHLNRHENFSICNPKNLTKKLVCSVCANKFHSIEHLRTHARIHLGEDAKRKDRQCPYCDRSFLGRANLIIHIRTHTGERPFPCDLCDQSFTCNQALVKHRRKHTGEKPYQCGLCSRQFAAKEVLNRHMKIHTGERPHKCEHCGKSFIQLTQLTSHLFHHTGENGFKCLICNATFHKKSLLINHTATGCETENKVNQECDTDNKAIFFKFGNTECSCCDKTFNTRVRYENHLKIVHKEDLKRILKEEDDSESQMNIVSISDDDDTDERKPIVDGDDEYGAYELSQSQC